MHMMDLSGQQFGRWTVLGRGENTAGGQAQWRVRCVCGSEKTLKSIVLRRGISQSCGCLNVEVVIARSTKHGHANEGAISPTYWSWAGMMARCYNPNNTNYKYYGGRGVTVCEQWHTFAGFLADMGEKPAGKTIDRIDNEGDYEPGNCRWATRQQQQSNRRNSNNRLLTFHGQTKTFTEWCAIRKINRATLFARLQTGWSEHDALATPVGKKRK